MYKSLVAILTLAVLSLNSIEAQPAVELQPLAQQIRRLETALTYLGQPFSPEVRTAINEAVAMPNEAAAVRKLQQILDPYVLAEVEINAESRVKVNQGAAAANVIENGTRLFLVKVLNQAGVTAALRVHSPNSGPTSLQPRTAQTEFQ